MKLYTPRRIRFERDIITRVYRGLGEGGKLSVKLGQQVTPDEIIGSSQLSLGFRTVNLSSLLSVSPKDVKKYLKKDFGQKIYKGELLAYKEGGLFRKKKIITAPTDGVLDFINNSGELKMSFLPKKIDLVSGVYGIVDDVDDQRGFVLIRTQVSRIFGVLGIGKSRDGILHKLSNKDDLIGANKISVKYTEQVLLCGSLIYKEAVTAAISAGIHGIIIGGLNAKDYRSMAGGRLVFPKKLDSEIGITIVCTEGFGSIPIGNDIYEILSEYDGRFVSIDGNLGLINLPSFSSSSMTKIKNTSLPKQTAQMEARLEMVEISLGQRVRIVGSSFRGEQGKVISIDKSKSLLPSGVYAYLVTLETKSRKVKVPSVNLEII